MNGKSITEAVERSMNIYLKAAESGTGRKLLKS
jgi:hypothetical protein